MISGSGRRVPREAVGPAGPLHLGPSPHIHTGDSTTRIMWTVTATLVPVLGVAFWHFGAGALLVVAAATLGAVGTERAFGSGGSLRDGSAALTGLLLGLTLPPGLPLWMAALGGVVSIGFGKLVFGGLGQNVFNPALLGRAFLQAAFPAALTTWPEPLGPGAGLYASNLALPFLASAPVDAVTAATPLGAAKFGGEVPELARLMVGTTPGSLGETAGVLILLCGGYLALKNYLNWRIPASILLTVSALSALFHALDPSRPDPPVMLFSGGLMLGAVYMATDMVTSPVTDRGAWIFGAGIGLLVVLIRLWGGLPEGVMYAILFMNALVPTIDRVTRPAPLGAARGAKANP